MSCPSLYLLAVAMSLWRDIRKRAWKCCHAKDLIFVNDKGALYAFRSQEIFVDCPIHWISYPPPSHLRPRLQEIQTGQIGPGG